MRKFLDMSRKVSLTRRDQNIRKDELMIKMSAECKTAKSEARKEFAEKLKQNVDEDINRIYAMGGIGGAVGPLCKFKDDIDNLLKEMENE